MPKFIVSVTRDTSEECNLDVIADTREAAIESAVTLANQNDLWESTHWVGEQIATATILPDEPESASATELVATFPMYPDVGNKGYSSPASVTLTLSASVLRSWSVKAAQFKNLGIDYALLTEDYSSLVNTYTEDEDAPCTVSGSPVIFVSTKQIPCLHFCRDPRKMIVNPHYWPCLSCRIDWRGNSRRNG